MAQSKIQSFIEANTNTGIGLVINFSAACLFYPLLGWGNVIDDWDKYVISTAFFTVLSVARSYFVRRWFETTSDRRLIIRDHERVNRG